MAKVIQKQVRLPINIAFGVVMQGIRIRFGRSVVTISGVALGIAFLMATFAGQMLRAGVSEEVDLRQALERMNGFLAAEMGPVRQRTLAVYQVGPMSVVESRYLQYLAEQRPEQINWATRGVFDPPAINAIKPMPPDQIGQDASALILVGQASGVVDLDFDALKATMRQAVIAKTRPDVGLVQADGVRAVNLERKLRDEEIRRMAEEERKSRFRNLWIVVISVLVTVIGIANSMLMSVTERFREIGTMKCLGALSAFIRKIFLLESSLIGLVGAIAGALFGVGFSAVAYTITFGGELVLEAMNLPMLLTYFLISVVIGVVLSIFAALYPAHVASRMVPASALRSTI